MKYSIITTAYNQLEQLQKAHKAWQSQSFGPLGRDFEWVIGDDGSDDGVIDWCKTNGISYATQPHQGYRYTVATKIAIEKSKGEYLVFVAGDCVPHNSFLAKIDAIITQNKVVNGMRLQVDADGNLLGADWRAEAASFDLDHDEIDITPKEKPWEYMTLTTLAISRKKYDELGGLFEGYDTGYGKMDWDLCANAFYHGMQLVWAPRAFVNHTKHPEREDTESSTKIFYDRLRQFQMEAK